MKKVLFLLLLSGLFTANAFADTIDYWHVYLNDSMIANFTENSKVLDVLLYEKKIDVSDLISVKYYNDTPCGGCLRQLVYMTDKNEYFVIGLANEANAPLQIPSVLLQSTMYNLKVRSLQLYYLEDKQKQGKPVMNIILK